MYNNQLEIRSQKLGQVNETNVIEDIRESFLWEENISRRKKCERSE